MENQKARWSKDKLGTVKQGIGFSESSDRVSYQFYGTDTFTA